MLVSIIIVSWNAKKFLELCLKSLYTSLLDFDHEIIVVDNASADGSIQMVMERFPRVRLICNESNIGFGKANNIGINNSKGDIIFLINSDVVVPKNCFDKIIPLFMNNKSRVGLIGASILDKKYKIQRSIMHFPSIRNTLTSALFLDKFFPKVRALSSYECSLYDHNSTKYVDVVNGCFMAISREALNDVGIFDEQFFIYGEDIDLCKRFRNKNWKILYFYEVKVLHFGGASSSNKPMHFFIEMLKANFQYWKKHHGTIKSKIYLMILIIHYFLRFHIYFTVDLLSETSSERSYKINRCANAVKWSVSKLAF